jgi:serine/threonine protein kinase
MILKNKYEDLESAFTSISSQSESSNGRVEDHEYIEDKHFKYFKIIRTLGTGSSSKVVLGINIHNNEKVAIKIVHRKNINNW